MDVTADELKMIPKLSNIPDGIYSNKVEIVGHGVFHETRYFVTENGNRKHDWEAV